MSHAGAAREAVVALQEAENGDKRLIAYVVGAEVESEELRRLLRDRLPENMAAWTDRAARQDAADPQR